MTATEQLPRFLTRGGAIVEIFAHAFTETYSVCSGEQAETHEGFAWRCDGCGLSGADRPWYTGSEPQMPTSRTVAAVKGNQHSTDCRSLPHDTTELGAALIRALLSVVEHLETGQPTITPKPGDDD